jgi:hypothetical protein
MTVISTVLTMIGGLLSAMITVIAGFVDGIGSGFIAILSLIPNAVGAMVTLLLNALGSLYGWFTETLPGLLQYFWENWSTMFWNAGKWLVETFVSAITNIGSLFEGLWSWITGSGGEALTAVANGVTDALKKGMDEISAVPGRNVGGLETSLKDTLGDVSKGFGDGMKASIDEAMAKLNEKSGKVELSGAEGGIDQGLQDDSATATKGANKGLVAATMERDSAETLRAIFNAQQNRQADKALKAQERSAKASEEGVGYLRTLASRQAEPALEAF